MVSRLVELGSSHWIIDSTLTLTNLDTERSIIKEFP